MPFRAPHQHATTPQGRGRFPGFDVLGEVDTWDDVTAGVVLARLAPTTSLSFFTQSENAAARTLCDLLLAQDSEPRIPVVALIDARLALGETDGWRHEDMPPDPQAWRGTLAALDADAVDRHGGPFAAATLRQQGDLIQDIYDAGSAGQMWRDWNASHVWNLWSRYTMSAFYSHPWAWNEIGFGGPAYPRGYKNLGVDRREPWEVKDAVDTDPVAFADRIEHARRDHGEVIGDRAHRTDQRPPAPDPSPRASRKTDSPKAGDEK